MEHSAGEDGAGANAANGEIGAGEPVSEQRGVRVTRTDFERYRVTTDAGVELEFGRGEGLVDPVDMLLAGLAGCMAVSIDRPLTRAAEPQRFDVDVVADKLKDEAMATRLQNLRLDFDVEFADWTRKQDPQAFVEKLLHAAHSTHCTVSRTIEAGAQVEADATVAVTGTSAAVGAGAAEGSVEEVAKDPDAGATD